MRDWTVVIDATTKAPVDDVLGDLLDLLAEYSVSPAGAGDHVSLTLTVTASDVRAAVDEGLALAHKALLDVDAPIYEAYAAEAMTTEEQDRRLAEPLIPALVGAADAAEILGVSRQRVHQLHTENPRFPEPVAQLRMGPIWLRASIEAFARSWSRKPGRPAASAS